MPPSKRIYRNEIPISSYYLFWVHFCHNPVHPENKKISQFACASSSRGLPRDPGAQGSREKSQYENLDWWTIPHGKNRLRRFWFLFNDYFLLAEYFRRNRGYWYFLYPWHIGFITIISFHILSFFGAVALLLGIPVISGSPSVIGNALYSFSLIMGVMSFSAGLFGSIGMLITRLTRSDLRDYATPQNYFTYIFLLAVFLSGLCAWLTADPNFFEYREFWKGLITFKPIDVKFASGVISSFLLFS